MDDVLAFRDGLYLRLGTKIYYIRYLTREDLRYILDIEDSESSGIRVPKQPVLLR